jgi:hypothetical protein
VQHSNFGAKRKEKMMSISINDYLDSVSAIAAAAQSAAVTGTTSQESNVSSDKDSYIASDVDPDAVLPCENYNDILEVMRSAKAEQASTSTDSDSNAGTASASGSDETEAVGASGGGGGGNGDDEDDEDETTTKIVTINGVTYLETTTVSDGITTVTRTAISAS